MLCLSLQVVLQQQHSRPDKSWLRLPKTAVDAGLEASRRVSASDPDARLNFLSRGYLMYLRTASFQRSRQGIVIAAVMNF